jgi:hypothetical protein
MQVRLLLGDDGARRATVAAVYCFVDADTATAVP